MSAKLKLRIPTAAVFEPLLHPARYKGAWGFTFGFFSRSVLFMEKQGKLRKRRLKSYAGDRIDVNGDYTPENCRWATAATQANNKRTNRVIEFGGERKTLQQWAHKTGILRETIAARLNAGWTVEKALNGGPAAPLLCGEKMT